MYKYINTKTSTFLCSKGPIQFLQKATSSKTWYFHNEKKGYFHQSNIFFTGPTLVSNGGAYS